MQAFKVKLNGKEIDKVFYSDSAKVDKAEVYKSLVEHDGYDADIVVIKERERHALNKPFSATAYSAAAPKGTFLGEFTMGDSLAKRKQRYRATGEFRKPRAGEYYLSGAIITAYYTLFDLGTNYWIAIETLPESKVPDVFIALLRAVTQSRIRGNPYASPEVKAALEYVAKERGIADKYDALVGL